MSISNWAIVIPALDNIIINNYDRKLNTYLEVGWDQNSIENYLSKKEYTMQIASFTNKYVSFTASSRRNRFYEVYNRDEMLEKDKLWKDSKDIINSLKNEFKIFILSSRSSELENKTRNLLEKWGFPKENIEIVFKKSNEILSQYRTKHMRKIKENYFKGIGICLDQRDAQFFDRFGYIPIGFSSIKYKAEFGSDLEFICDNWNQLYDVIHYVVERESKELKNTQDIRLSNQDNTLGSECQDVQEDRFIPESMLEKAIYHQLFLGQNHVMGTCDEGDINELMGVGNLIRTFMRDLKSNMKLIFTHPDRFFEYYQNKFEADLSDTIESIQTNIAAMMEIQSDKLTPMYIVLTKLLESLRAHSFNKWGLRRLKEEYSNKMNKTMSNEVFENLNKMISTNQSDLSYLSDLSFLTSLARGYSNQLLLLSVNQLINQRIIQILNKI